MFYTTFYVANVRFILVLLAIPTSKPFYVLGLLSDVSEAMSNTFATADQTFCGCTLHFPESNLTNNPNITSIEISMEKFQKTVKLFSTLSGPQDTVDNTKSRSSNFSKTIRYNFNSDLSPIYWTTFSIQRHSSPCTVRVISTTNAMDSLSNTKIVNLTPYIFSGLLEYRYDEDWDEIISNLRKISPDYILALIPIISEGSQYFIISPESMASSKIIVLTETSYYTNCFVCSKWRLLIGGYLYKNFLNFYRMSRVSILVNLANFTDSPTKQLIDDSWFDIHKDLQGFGMPDGSGRGEGQTCSEILLKGIQQTTTQHYPEQYCIIYLILESLNCTSFSCRRHLVLNLNYYSSIVNENFGGSDYAIAHGAQWDGLRFSMVLAGNEGRRSYAGLGAISRPFTWCVWLMIGLAIILMTLAVLQTGRALGIGRALLWVIGSMFEDSGILDVRMTLVFGWIFACFFARNLYTSVLYSYLTKQPNPENVPENMQQLFENDNQSGITIFADVSVSYQIERHMGLLKARYDGNLHGFDEIVNKVKLIWIDLNTTEFIRNTSSLKSVKCRDMVTETYEEDQCSVEGRLAILYNIIGWRTKTSPRFVKPMISLFGGRKLVENVNSPSILNEPVLWFTAEKFFYLGSFQRILAQLFESGIQSTFRMRYEKGVIGNIMKDVEKGGNFGFQGNLMKFAEKVVSRTGYVGDDEDNKEKIWGDNDKVSLRDVWVASVLWLYGLIGCIIGATLEQLWWSRDNANI